MILEVSWVVGRRYGGSRGSRKPDSIPSFIWVNLSKKQKEKAIEDEARELARKEFNYQEGGSAGSSAKPSAAALPTKDCWKVIGDKVVTCHLVPGESCSPLT